ncbi:MAG: MCE family protein [Deltaproteobacteria bacterium]|nr:MAG: MCE family protein [Deltaproteobacteria bacterium]
MKNLSQGIKVGILVLLMTVGSYGVWKMIGRRASGGGSYALAAQFRDASGLPIGSRVVIAGLPVGEIAELQIQGRYARVVMKLRDDLRDKVYDNAVAMKKSSSLLGDYYIEIDPGTPTSIDPAGDRRTHAPLPDGAEIERVVEATSPDALMRRIEQSMPKVDEVLVSVRDLSEDVRALVNGPIASMANRLDRLVQEQARTVESILARTDDALARIQDITRDIRAITRDADDKVDRILAETEQLVTRTREEIEQTGASVREKLDLVDEFLDRSTSIATKIDEDKGTLGRLVNDSTLADNLEDITGDAKNFVRTLFGMETWVGLRSEFHYWPNETSNLFAGNHYVSVELRTRPDKFYLIEFNRGFRGAFPETELVVDPVTNDNGTTEFRRRVRIRDGTRITFQFGKRIGWASLRFGIKESSGGVGIDGQWFDDRLKVSADVFDTTFDALPRLKLTAAYSFFRHIYVIAGMDDVLNRHQVIQPEPQDAGGGFEGGIPIAFEDFHTGRSAFFGAYLQFNDLDLTALLTIGSGILMAAAE